MVCKTQFVNIQSQADFQEKVSVLFAETDTFEWKSIWREATRNKAKRNRGVALNNYDYLILALLLMPLLRRSLV